MKWIKSHSKFLNEDIITATDSLTFGDVEIISDILLEFCEKWGLEVYINERGFGNNVCQIQKFSGFFIDLTIKFDTNDKNRKSFVDDLEKCINRIPKFGYNILPEKPREYINSIILTSDETRPLQAYVSGILPIYCFFKISKS